MMFFITSVVPPAMVLERLPTRRRPLRMSSPAIAARPSTSAAYSANDCPSVDHASLMSPATAPLGPPPSSTSERSPSQPRMRARRVDRARHGRGRATELAVGGRGAQEGLDLADEVARDLDHARALVAERRHRDAPPAVEGAEERVLGDDHVLVHDLGEVALAGGLDDRAARDARGVERHEQRGDPPVRGRVGIGPHEEHAVRRPHADRRPDLGAVHHEVVVLEHGAAAQAREVAARVGFAEPLAPHLFGAEDALEVHLLLGRSRRRDRGTDVLRAEHRDPSRCLGPSELGVARDLVLDAQRRVRRSRPATRAPTNRVRRAHVGTRAVRPTRRSRPSARDDGGRSRRGRRGAPGAAASPESVGRAGSSGHVRT